MKRPACAHCGGDGVVMRRQIIANGTPQFAWHCTARSRWALTPPQWIKHDILRRQLAKQGAAPEDIPVVGDWSDAIPCVICGEPGEVHHWSPQAYSEYFGDGWHLWPTAALCRLHHRQWHEIVTPELVGVG